MGKTQMRNLKSRMGWLHLALAMLVSVTAATRGYLNSDLSEVLGSKYMHLNRDMCFSYNNHVGSYAQTSSMIPLWSTFESVVDVSGVQPGSVFKFTLHRNTH